MPRFICDNCEDHEVMEISEFRKGMHCECGGHLHLELKDHFKKHADKCGRCANRWADLCMECKWLRRGD